MHFSSLFLENIRNKFYLCTKKRMKGYKMDTRFTPRTHEEMLAAVRAFQARQRKWFEESNKRLEKRVIEHELVG